MPRDRIEHIAWVRAQLKLQLSDAAGAEATAGAKDAARYVIASVEDPRQWYPLACMRRILTLFLPNVTQRPGREMLPRGRWFFASLDNDGQPHPLELADAACKELGSLDRIFPYGREGRAYSAALVAEEVKGHEACVLRVGFVRVPEAEASGPRRSWAARLAAHMADGYLTALYALLSRCHKHDGSHILLMSETKSRIDGNLLALDQRLGERELIERYAVTRFFQETLALPRLALLKAWSQLVVVLAKQDYVFIDDYAPIFKLIKPNKRTRLIQVWHAGVGFKAVGYARFGKPGSPDALASGHRRYDYVIVGSTPLIPVYQEVFALPEERFLPLGLPRIDSFLADNAAREAEDDLLARHPEFEGKRRILFAPTYRGTGQAEAFYPADALDLKEIFEFCGDNTVFLVKLHPFIKDALTIPADYAGRIFDVSSEDLKGLLPCADALVTDYSSIIYEYSLLDRPMYFFAFDLEEYQGERGFHWDYEQIAPGTVCRTLDDLLAALQAKDGSRDKRAVFRVLGFDHLDAHNTDRLIDTILKP